ncbi:multicopper oxidase family protein [Kitasatospora sp. NPDC088548]|uniref:multicopper oxidase family protein n=1 Tax=Kitasatospora sp. NPDC088548 TaxID=3364075 RepID=UPI00382AF086
MNRRRFLGLGSAAVGAGALTAVAVPAAARMFRKGSPGRLLSSEVDLPEPFRLPLPVPPVLAPVRTEGTTDFYEITQQVAKLEILPGLRTDVWTYGGIFPGPTLSVRAGRRTAVLHRNQLPVPTTVHLHGGHTPADSDGYAIDLTLPAGATGSRGAGGMAGMPGMERYADDPADTPLGNTSNGERTYTYPGKQRAATLWYHDHRMGFTGLAIWSGLIGFHLIHDEEEDALPLPRGERDLPLMLVDRSFGEDGAFRYPTVDAERLVPGVRAGYMNGVLGDVILVNGAPWPRHPVDRARYRLRLLNASNARVYRLELDPQPPGGDALVQIGGDGGLLEAPRAHDVVDIAPAERFDLVVDFSRFEPGTSVRLMNRFGTGSAREVMRFDVSSRTVSDDSRVPERLSTIEWLDPADAVITRNFRFRLSKGDGWTINKRLYLPGRALARPTLGAVERWRFFSDLHHPVHVHLNQFQVLSRNGSDPGPYDAGWKDTVDLRSAEAVEVLVRFTDYPGTYMMHCHNLEHEDMAMMADFVVE